MKYKPTVVSSLHGFKSHGKWQTKLSDFASTQDLKAKSFDYGYQFFSCLIPGFKKRLIVEFYSKYSEFIKNRDYLIDIKNPKQRPSIIAHSLGSYILCNAMLKYSDIKFDKIILCGSIVHENFEWDTLFKRNQVHFVRNEYSPQDKVVRWGWVLSLNNAGQSGWRGFNYSSNAFEQEQFDYFDHGSFFEGSHMEEYWLPFLQKETPSFQIVNGAGIDAIPIFTKHFDQTTKIDDASYGDEPFWDEFSIPDGLAEKWVEVNRDIYSFLVSDEKLDDTIGYINAMPLKKEVFEKLLNGKVHDNEIRPENIVSYTENEKEIDLYIMSVALHPNFQAMHLGLKDLGFEKLLNCLVDKLRGYYINSKIKIKRIAAVGWTDKGVRLCKMLGMSDTGNTEEKTNKPIYALEINNTIINDNKVHKSIRNLAKLYFET